jgi:hypothetical protein
MSKQFSFANLTRDLIDLAELQLELLHVDSQAARRKLNKALICGVVAVTLGGSALTVLLIGCGFLLRDLAQWPMGVSVLAVAILALVIVAVLLAVALAAVRKASAAMSESKSEFVENVKWLKATLIAPSRSPRNQLRSESFPRRYPEPGGDGGRQSPAHVSSSQ